MTPGQDDWNAIALAKLTKVLGDATARLLMKETLASLGLTELRSATDLHRFGAQLASKGGFPAAIGGMLTLHATMYGESPRTPR